MASDPVAGREAGEPAARSAAPGPRGAFGLELSGTAPAAWLNPVPERHGWPVVRLHMRRFRSTAERSSRDSYEHHWADIAVVDDDRAVIDREAGTATLLSELDADDGRLTHPFVTAVASVYGWWLGRVVLHGGAFCGADGAYGLIGEGGAGKSSLLAGLAAAGRQVLTDDLVVLEHGRVLAGPRCVDLRARALDLLDIPAARLQSVRRPRRHRLPLGEVPLAVPLRGWFFLAWGSRAGVRPLSPAERLGRLSAQRSAGDLLELLELPGWELRRPRTAQLAESVEMLAEAVGPAVRPAVPAP